MIVLPNSDRRKSNEGYRALPLNDRVLMFLTRVRKKTPFKELGYLYGVGEESARRYVEELITIFSEDLVPCLVYPRPTEEIRAMTEPKIREDYPDLLAILDATNWHQLKPGNFLHNRLTYSAYKHDTVFQVLMDEWFNRLERVFG